MKRIAKPDSFVTVSDKIIVAVALIVALVCTLAIPSPIGTVFNDVLRGLVSAPVAMMMLLIPLGIYCGIHINQQVKFNDILLERKRLKEARGNRKKLLFYCRMTPTEEGTVWDIVNANKFAWTNAKLLIERTFDGEIVTEKLNIGDMPSQTKRELVADLVDIECARWRVMVISQEGQQVDFPDKRAPKIPIATLNP